MIKIYKHIEKSSNILKKEMENNDIYGFLLTRKLYDIMEEHEIFSKLDSRKQDIIIMRILDNIER